MKKRSILIAIPLLLMLTGCGNLNVGKHDEELVAKQVTESNVPVVPDDDPSIPDGKAQFEKMNCAQCHGTDGNGSISQILSKQDWARKASPLQQYEFLAYGKPGVNHVKLQGIVTRRLLWDLVFYSRSFASPPLSDEKIAEMDNVFGSNCAVCHGKRGHGDGPLAHNMEPVPANFHQYSRFYDRTDDVLWDHIANGIKWEGMPNFLNKQDRAKKVVFNDAYIRQLVQYVRHFHSSNKPTLANASPQTTNTDGSVGKETSK